MIPDLTENPPKRPYRVRPPGTWAAIRRRYEAGESGRALSDWYGVALRTIRGRARREGWRRMDAGLSLSQARDGAALDLLGAAELAGERAVREMIEGAPAQAQLYGRLAELLVRLLDRLDRTRADAPHDPFADTPARRAALKILCEAHGPLDSED